MAKTAKTPPAPPTPLDRRPLLDVNQVKTWLGCSDRVIYRWLAEGRFPEPLRVSRRFVRWRPADIDSFIAGTWKPAKPN